MSHRQETLKHMALAIDVLEAAILAAQEDLTESLFKLIAQNAPRASFFRTLRDGVSREMLKYAEMGYKDGGGAHLPINDSILNKAIDTQLRYAKRFEDSGDELNPVRVGMYAREAEHIGTVVGFQQAMKERGAVQWRRILHPEDSKTGPCPQCTADAELVHPIDMPFFEYHPLGVCSVQGVRFDSDKGGIEIPVPGENPQGFIKQLRTLFENIKSIVRRVRR